MCIQEIHKCIHTNVYVMGGKGVQAACIFLFNHTIKTSFFLKSMCGHNKKS